MNRFIPKLAILLVCFMLLTSIFNSQVNAARHTEGGTTITLADQHKNSSAEAGKRSLAEAYDLAEAFIQSQLDQGYTLDEVKQALALTKENKGTSLESNLAEVSKPIVNRSKQVESEIVNTATFETMSLLSDPVVPKVETKPNGAPFVVNLDNETISTLSGGLTIQETDLVLPGRNGLSFALTRIYDSSSSQFYPLDYTTGSTMEEKLFPIGKGWVWNLSYIEKAGTKKYLHLAGGGTYELNGTTIKGYPWLDIAFSADTTVTVNGVASANKVTSIQGISQYFSADGKLIQIADPYNNTIQFHYSTQGNYTNVLSSIKDVIGNTIDITYSDGQVKLTLGNNTVTYFKIKESGKELLGKVRDPLNRETTYDYAISTAKYNLQGTTPAQDNPYALITGVMYPTGAQSLYTYETTPITRYIDDNMVNQTYRITGRKNQITYTDLTTHDFSSKSITYTGDMGSSYDADLTFSATIYNGRMTTEYFNKKDYIDTNTPTAYYNTKIVSTAGTRQVVTDYTYDEARRFDAPIQIASKFVDTSGGGSASPIKLTVKSYDDYGNVTSSVDPNNVMMTYTYNATTHLLDSVTEPVSSTQTRYTAFTRNTQGDITQIQVRETNASGALLQQTDYVNIDAYGNVGRTIVKESSGDIVTDYEYSTTYHSAYLTKQSATVTDVEDHTSVIDNSFEYELSSGNLTQFTDGNGHVTQYQYDKLGRLIKTIHPDLSTIGVAYDDFNNILTLTDEVGITTVTRWNPMGWKTESGLMEAGTYKAKSKIGYDDYGRVIWQEDAIGNRTQFQYDAWDRGIQTTYADLTNAYVSYDDINQTMTSTDAEGNQIIETYDILGRVKKQEEKKPGGIATTQAEYVYDYIGNVREAKDAKQKSTLYSYDMMGRLIGVTNAKQETTQYSYNMRGHLTQTTYPDQTFTLKKYDELGRMIKKTDGNDNFDQYFYDGNGNLERRIDRNKDSFTFVYDDRDFLTDKISTDETISFTYDDAGKRLTMADGTGTTTNTYTYTYDPYNGGLTQVTFPDAKSIQYAYDANGRRLQMTEPFGGNVYYDYDAMNRLIDIGTAYIDGNSDGLNDDYEARYAYYDNGLLRQIQRKNGNASTYTYDGLNLDTLTHRKADNTIIQSFDYNYDANGNIETRKENGAATSFGYDVLNRIATSSQFAETYDYDSKGNRTSYVRNQLFENDNDTLVYDDRDRLTQVTTTGGQTASYRYNGDNLLYERTENGQTTRYYYDGDQVIAEADVVNGQPVLKARYLRGQGLVSVEDTTQSKAYYLQNGHGDVIELRDDSGNTSLNSYSYDIWGNTIIAAENVHNIFRYSGEMWDRTTSLQYLRARWYDPSDGRFINEDSFEGQIDNPLSLNLYAYVQNNPLIYADPTGHKLNLSIYNWSNIKRAFNVAGNRLLYDFRHADQGLVEVTDFLVVDDIKTIFDPNASTFDKTLAVASFIPVGKVVKGGKIFIKLFNGEKEIVRAVDYSDDAWKAVSKIPCNCFTAGTKVITDEGEKNIEDIEVGDKVLSKDENTGGVGYKEVTATFNHETGTDEVYKIHVGDQVIESTFNHPFWVDGQGWTFVKDLEVGDLLVQSDGNTLKIESIELEHESATVYNMTVDEFHTYFVSDLGIWVHNTSCMDSASAAKIITNADRSSTALSKSDPGHRAASFLSEAELAKGTAFNITGGDGVQRNLLQVNGGLNGKNGIYEYIIDSNGTVSHQRFIEGGIINGVPNQKVKP